MLPLIAALALITQQATPRPLTAAFTSRSYTPGSTALLRVEGAKGPVSLELFRAGFGHRDRLVDGLKVSGPRTVTGTRIRIRVGPWRTGVYFARLTDAHGTAAYAPFVLRPARFGRARVLVVVPTNTWQAYNFEGGDSWYENAAVHDVDLARPFIGNGLPPHFRAYDLGFLRWFAASGFRADFISDDDLSRFANGGALERLYRLVVFPGHEEYATARTYDLLEQFRNAGGNLAFLSANNIFYRVQVSGDHMLGRTRWRDRGRPEAALEGAQYIGWNLGRYPNRPYVVDDVRAAPWLFAGTGLHDGSRIGNYGIEIDHVAPVSPPGTKVLAEIPNDFGPGMTAQMTYYRRGRSQVFDAGVINFGSSADWPIVRQLVTNLWRHMSAG